MARPTKGFSVAGETSWLGWVFSTLLRDQPIATSSTSPTTGDANERVILIGVVKRVGEESMWTSIPPEWWGESVRPRSPGGGRLRCQTHISTMVSIRSCRHAAQESLPLMVGHLHKLNPGETSLEWGIWTKGSIPHLGD